MESTTRLLLPEVTAALNTDPTSLVELTEEMLPADLADLTSALELDLARTLVRALPVEISARLIEHLDEEFRRELFVDLVSEALPTAVAITDEMAPDDRADLLGELEPEQRQAVLADLDPEESKDIRTLLAYEEDSAGSIMTTDFVSLASNETVAESIEQVRRTAREMETVYSAYAVDSHGTLLGVVSLRDLVTAPETATVEEIMNPNIVTADAEEDQEEVARLIAKYDLLALPVVDRTHRIVGIVTVDDVIDVVEEEATEDAQRMGAVEPIEQPYMTTPLLGLVRARAPWLVILFVAQFLTGAVLAHYTDVLGLEDPERVVATAAMLMWFVPLIISSGGNAGSQSATLVIRAMAVGEVEPKDALRILGKELAVGLTLGVLLAAFGVARILFFDELTSVAAMGMTMAFSVMGVVVVGALLGAGIPLLLERIGVDPAVSSTPFIASLVDIAGLVIYFEIARSLLF